MSELACNVRFYIDSGAGQCMCSCVDAFSGLRACAIVVVGVSGSLPIHSFGTASFLAIDSDGQQRILRIHNCLLCQSSEANDSFNLISVSQVLRTKLTTIQFSTNQSSLSVKHGKRQQTVRFDLIPDDGLYAIDVVPLNASDPRHKQLASVDITVNDTMGLGTNREGTAPKIGCAITKPASRLGSWYMKVLWIGKIVSLAGKTKGFQEGLQDFCDEYIAPLAIPSARRTYQTDNVDDLADLSIRFLGIGSERLKRTIERSIGLSPMIKVDGKTRHRRPIPVPSLNFPPGRWKSGKTPKVDKGIIHNLHQAGIGEVLYMDTFEVDDFSYRYAQAFVDYRSNYGDIIPLRSRSQVGRVFTEFCARNFTPLILIRDNIGEHIGGELLKECLHRSVKSAFICPYRKQQNYAEGYLGRVTALASYGMVYSGAPMFMWIWCIDCAVFINNITAAFYSSENVWATPYELLHNEPFMDTSIVVPFGCGVLVLLNEDERGKFHSRCALMIFAHYTNQHPLYTYAVYSPKSKRILFRQDCIFLTNLFPMRTVRSREGLHVDGDVIIPYRSPLSVRNGGDEDLSFKEWSEREPLPLYQDHVTGYNLTRPGGLRPRCDPKPDESQYVHPNHPSFGPQSMVKVPYVPIASDIDVNTNQGQLDICDAEHETMIENLIKASDKYEAAIILQPEAIRREDLSSDGNGDAVFPDEVPSVRRSRRSRRSKTMVKSKARSSSQQRRPVGQRWYYDPVPVCVMTSEESGIISDSQTEKDIRSNEVLVVQPADSEPTADYGPPYELGPVVPVSIQDIQAAGDDEWAAWFLQGIVFYDDELEWCRIIGWGAECGVIIVHYSPVTALDHIVEEHHSSLSDMLSMIMRSPIPPVIPDYLPSRVLHRSEAQQKALCYRQSGYTVLQRDSRDFGSCKVRQLGARVGSYNGKVLSTAVIKRILRAQETIFKYGTMIPRNDSEADRSPEASRWISGRSLEWIRLNQVSTFDSQWTWKKVQQMYPKYLKSDIGHMFFIYDYKYSGEHRVRLVFDGSKQSPATYSVTYAPTVRAESVRHTISYLRC
jgi:hypothetical protein